MDVWVSVSDYSYNAHHADVGELDCVNTQYATSGYNAPCCVDVRVLYTAVLDFCHRYNTNDTRNALPTPTPEPKPGKCVSLLLCV